MNQNNKTIKIGSRYFATEDILHIETCESSYPAGFCSFDRNYYYGINVHTRQNKVVYISYGKDRSERDSDYYVARRLLSM